MRPARAETARVLGSALQKRPPWHPLPAERQRTRVGETSRRLSVEVDSSKGEERSECALREAVLGADREVDRALGSALAAVSTRLPALAMPRPQSASAARSERGIRRAVRTGSGVRDRNASVANARARREVDRISRGATATPNFRALGLIVRPGHGLASSTAGVLVGASARREGTEPGLLHLHRGVRERRARPGPVRASVARHGAVRRRADCAQRAGDVGRGARSSVGWSQRGAVRHAR